MKFYQANFEKIKVGRHYYIFLKKKVVRVKVISPLEDYNRKIHGQNYLDIGVMVKRLDNDKVLPQLRSPDQLYTRNGS